MLHLFENPIDKSEHQIIHEQLELMRAAEDLETEIVAEHRRLDGLFAAAREAC